MNRRRFLSGVATGGSLALSGCVGPFSDDQDQEDKEPSIEIVSPSEGDTVPLSFDVKVKVENYNIRPLDKEEDYGHVDLLLNQNIDISEGEKVPYRSDYNHLGQGQVSGQVEAQVSGEYELKALLSTKNHIATEYMDTITLTVQEQFEFTSVYIDSNENQSYDFRAVYPERNSDLVFAENQEQSSNPDITLVEDEKYKFVFGSTLNDHPFEIQDSEGTPLLSAGNDGELESNEDIDFSVSDRGIMIFTATDELVSRAEKYACTNHPENMNGDII